MPSEQEQFLKDIEVLEDSNLDKPLGEDIEVPKKAGETDFHAKNRRERRLQVQNQQLREEAIATNARLEALTQAQNVRKDEEADYLKKVERIYGNATPEAKEATELLKDALRGVHESARTEALNEAMRRVQADREQETAQVAEEEENLDVMMDNLEDNYGADFGNERTRVGFLDLLEKASPKDKDGNIIEYADPETVWQLYESQQTKGTSRAKELASRSMTRGGTTESTVEKNAVERFLKENNII